MADKSEDIDWLAPLAILVALETLAARTVELTPVYSVIALLSSAIIALAWLFVWVLKALGRREEHPMAALANLLRDHRSRILCAGIGIQVAAIGMSAFAALKAHIPATVPFYADHALANFDVRLFGEDAWTWFDHYFGALAYPISLIYGAWLPTHLVAFTLLVLFRPSPLKSQAIIAFGLMWVFLGVCLAYAFSSVGPIFYDRLYGGDRFAGLVASVRPFFMVTESANYLWSRYASGNISIGGGISAMPSLHLAGTLWLALIIRRAAPRLAPLGWAYLVAIYLGSVMLGWHYATDGLVGMAGLLLAWALAGRMIHWRQTPHFGRLAAHARPRA